MGERDIDFHELFDESEQAVQEFLRDYRGRHVGWVMATDSPSRLRGHPVASHVADAVGRVANLQERVVCKDDLSERECITALEYFRDRCLDGGDKPGTADVEMLPYLLVINALQGVTTLQSCAGHLESESKRDGGDGWGHLWLYVTQDVRGRLGPLPDGVRKVKHEVEPSPPWRICLDFEGRAHGRLHESMLTITDWLKTAVFGDDR